jgi:hypothetical protein
MWGFIFVEVRFEEMHRKHMSSATPIGANKIYTDKSELFNKKERNRDSM